MRVEFANALIKNYTKTANQVFITGDLGFMALDGVDVYQSIFTIAKNNEIEKTGKVVLIR